MQIWFYPPFRNQSPAHWHMNGTPDQICSDQCLLICINSSPPTKLLISDWSWSRESAAFYGTLFGGETGFCDAKSWAKSHDVCWTGSELHDGNWQLWTTNILAELQGWPLLIEEAIDRSFSDIRYLELSPYSVSLVTLNSNSPDITSTHKLDKP